MKIHVLFLFLLACFYACNQQQKSNVDVSGELKVWHKVTLTLEGPETSEWAKENPFLDYKLEVVFTKGDKKLIVPGYYAADGNAAETSADQGNIWKVHFRPDEAGEWNYEINFKKGENIAVVENGDFGESLDSDGFEGALEIEALDKTGKDLRAKGRIVNGGKGYLKFQGSDEIWIKNGADSPENFLAYFEFDQTSRFSLKREFREGEANPNGDLHKYEAHLQDWRNGDPSWQNEKGKNIIGALNYLSSVGVNSVYMLTMNIQGDGKDVWPYNDHNERYRFDCSKLDQWEIVFEHMESLGMMAHFVLQETENECLLDMGYTEVQRKLYLRELIARFSHHLALSWNIGEENGPTNWSPIGQTEEQKRAMVNYIKNTNPYPCNVFLHTHSDDFHQDEYLTPLLRFENLDGPSMQIGNPERVHERVKKWVDESNKTGKRWIVNLDEIGPAKKGVLPDSYDENHDTIRQHCLWGTLLAGGAGVEWYFGYRYPHNDLGLEDFRSRDEWWKQSTIATGFVKQFPLEEMKSCDALVRAEGGFCLAKPDSLYLIYFPIGNIEKSVYLESEHEFSVKWFNPRIGGDLIDGKVPGISGKGFQNIGEPPSDSNLDWMAVVQRK